MKALGMTFFIGLMICSCSDNKTDVSNQKTGLEINYYEYMDPSMDDVFDLVVFDYMDETGNTFIRNHYEPIQLRDAFIKEALVGGGQIVAHPSRRLIGTDWSDSPNHQGVREDAQVQGQFILNEPDQPRELISCFQTDSSSWYLISVSSYNAIVEDLWGLACHPGILGFCGPSRIFCKASFQADIWSH